MTATVLLLWAYLAFGFVVAGALVLVLFAALDAHSRGMDRVRQDEER